MPELSLRLASPPHNDLLDRLGSQGLELTHDGYIRWVKGSPQHPRNWPAGRKVYNAALVMFLDFFISAVGAVGASAADGAHNEFATSKTVALVGFISMFFLGQAVGGIMFPPYSESFGRKRLYIFSITGFAAFSIIIPTIHSLAAVYIGRFMTGFFSAIPSIVAAGSIEDVFDEKTRMWLVSVWLIVANLSLVIGPIFAAYVSSSVGWRWIFYISTIIAVFSTLLLMATRESRATHLLEQRVHLIRKATGDVSLRTQNPDHVPDLRTFIRVVLFRPLRLLFTEPIVSMVSAISALAFALIYLFTEVLPIVYGFYGFSNRQTSLAFIAIGLGFLCSIFTRIYDHKLVARHGNALSPEEKLTGFAIAAPAFAIGLWWFAWTIPPAVYAPWIVSMMALIPVGFAINEFDCVLVGYLTDAYTTFASSAFASLSLLRSVFSATFPLFARQMYTSLGANYATTTLAGIATVTCVSPLILIRYGRRIRQASKFASYSLTLGHYEIAGNVAEGDVAVRVTASKDN